MKFKNFDPSIFWKINFKCLLFQFYGLQTEHNSAWKLHANIINVIFFDTGQNDFGSL